MADSSIKNFGKLMIIWLSELNQLYQSLDQSIGQCLIFGIPHFEAKSLPAVSKQSS